MARPLHIIFLVSLLLIGTGRGYAQGLRTIAGGDRAATSSGLLYDRLHEINSVSSGTLCPSTIPLNGIDTLGVNTIPNGSSVACNAKPFFVFADYGAISITDSISGLFS